MKNVNTLSGYPATKWELLHMIRTFVEKDLQYVIEAHIRIYRDEYNYDHSFAEFIAHAVQEFERSGNYAREMGAYSERGTGVMQ
ncbi:hypothetical protein [Paenibacillus pabuli]|uniref:hypothetical protein n=1 Tax=Paenibacillus pabuli TaxID=1472 RepID=UPI0007831D51|nr:hypothetical protein [Paenibacillus pabuli]MEC0126697.1 hypothetical protein [Paenibacillus pabuli]